MHSSQSMAPCVTPILLALVFVPGGVDGTVYPVDDSGGYGRRFDGIGGLSGGGATSKLLVNYPERQRNEILDFLFKPNYGASLHMLKVEIGGDAQSTDGTESSHMHESWDERYDRGYEWWLMKEAKKRNPDILLYGLPWAFPGWVGNGTLNPYENIQATANYIIRWITGALTFHGLNIDIIGIWNERPYNVSYIKLLKTLMGAEGLLKVQICAADDFGWGLAQDILNDNQLEQAVGVIGSHYPGTLSDADAIQTGKALWASEENGTPNNNTGAGCWARLINQDYVNGMMTATISWNLIAAYYYGLPWYRGGLMSAMEPWSGHYTVEPPIWTTAHTTQFTKPGWWYLRHGAGVGKLSGGSSYVSLTNQTDPNSLTIVIETMSHDHSVCIRPPLPPYDVIPQNATFRLSGSFSSIRSLYVWYTKLGFDGEPSTIFKQLTPIQVVNGAVSLSLGVDEVYTLTTVPTGRKGSAPAPPASTPFPLPYKDNFDGYTPPSEPYNLAQQKGVWEVVDVGPPRNGVIRQVVQHPPIYWCSHGPQDIPHTANIIGNYNWTNIYVQIDAHIGDVNATDGVYVAARVDKGGCDVSLAEGLFFFLFPKSQKYEITRDLLRQDVLRTGSVPLARDWNTLGLLVQDNKTVAFLNGQPLFTVPTPLMPQNGYVGIGTTTPGLADFDNRFIDKSKSF